MKAYEYSMFIVLRGDPGAVENAMDEIVGTLPLMDLDEVNITVLNRSEATDD